jgi:hypothetical protein
VLWVSQQLDDFLEDVIIRYSSYGRCQPRFRTVASAIRISSKLIDQKVPATPGFGHGERPCDTFADAVGIWQLQMSH